MHHDNVGNEVATQEFDMERSKIFNFYSIRSVIVTELKTKSSQRIDTCEYKIDTGSDGNPMSVRMYEMHFPNTNINGDVSSSFC